MQASWEPARLTAFLLGKIFVYAARTAVESPAAQAVEEEPTVREESLWDERAVANTSALHLVFLGTGADSRTNERLLFSGGRKLHVQRIAAGQPCARDEC